MAILPPTFRQRYFSASGLPLSGGKLYTYEAGTTTPLATYTDATEASANTNPIILDANGECNLWLGGFAYKIVLTDSNDVTQWTQDNINQASIDSAVSADLLENLGVVCTAQGGGVITISVKTGAGNVPGPSDPIRVGFRGGSLSSGLVSLVTINGPLAMNLANGATLGQSDGVTAYTYVYLINNNGTAELAVSSAVYTESALLSTTIMNSSSDSASTMYSTVARSNVPIRLIARLTMNQVTAGVWANVPSEIQTGQNAKNGAAPFTSTPIASYTNATTSYTTAATISFTTTGRPCEWGVYQNDTTVGTCSVQSTSSTSNISMNIKLVNTTSATDVSVNLLGTQIITAVSGYVYYVPPGPLGFFTLTAGTYSFDLSVRCGGSNLSSQINNMRFFIREL